MGAERDLLAQALQPEGQLETTQPGQHGGAHTGLRLPFAPSRWAWVASSPSLLLLFMRPTPLSQVSPPPQLLNVGKYRSFLLPHFRVVGEREGKGRRNVPISICIETASLSS